MGRSYSDIKGSFGWMEERKRTDRETERQKRSEAKRKRTDRQKNKEKRKKGGEGRKRGKSPPSTDSTGKTSCIYPMRSSSVVSHERFPTKHLVCVERHRWGADNAESSAAVVDSWIKDGSSGGAVAGGAPEKNRAASPTAVLYAPARAPPARAPPAISRRREEILLDLDLFFIALGSILVENFRFRRILVDQVPT